MYANYFAEKFVYVKKKQYLCAAFSAEKPREAN